MAEAKSEPKLEEKLENVTISENNGKSEENGGAKTLTLKEIFEAFAKFGGGDPKHITLSNSDKWFKQAKVFDKKLTTVDTGICFKKLKQKAIDFKTFNIYLEDLAKTKGIPVEDIKAKLVAGGPPNVSNATKPQSNTVVERLTDASKYTGSHKERFDTSTGKGKGKEGRVDVLPKDGYVAGYKNRDTFDKTH